MGKASKQKMQQRKKKAKKSSNLHSKQRRWGNVLEFIAVSSDEEREEMEKKIKKNQETHWIYKQSESVVREAIDNYFSDPELLAWVNSFWNGKTFYLEGEKYDALDYVASLKCSVLKPGGFDFDHRIAILTGTGEATMGGINMGTGIPWINPNFPDNPSPPNGVYSLGDLLPDWEKSLFDYIKSCV